MPFEVEIITFLQSFSTPALDLIFKIMAYCFDYPLVIVIALIFLIFRKYNYLFFFLGVEGVGFGAQLLLKKLINRPRPFLSHESVQNILEASNSSFPSGHSITVMCASVVVFFFIKDSKLDERKKWALYLSIALIDVLCLINRMYLGQHYLTDVLGGFLIAIAVGLVGRLIFFKFSVKRGLKGDNL